MRRRDVIFALASLGLTPILSWAGGHNKFCQFRDNGGGFTSNRRILVMGGDYRTHVANVRRDQPTVVLAERPEQYAQALRDMHYARPSRYADESVVVMDLSRNPELALAKLDTKIGRIRVVHDVPTNADHLMAIHGPNAPLSALPTLRGHKLRLNERGAVDLTASKTPANSQLQKVLDSSNSNDFVIVIGHRARRADVNWDPALPKYEMRFHDGSTLAFTDTMSTKPTVWFLSCQTFDDVVAVSSGITKPAMATTKRLTYGQAAKAAELMEKTGGSLRKVVSKIQSRPVPKTKRANKKTPQPPESGEHPPPEPVNDLFHLIVQTNDGAIMATDESIRVA